MAPAYAPFGRRVAALAIDAVVLAVLLAAVVHAANLVSDAKPFATLWSSRTPVWTHGEVASRTSERASDGTLRETTVSRETRIFADGTLRIYAVAEARFTASDGKITTTRAENMIGRNVRDLLRTLATGGLAFVLSFAYFLFFEASPAQATPGKALLGLKVADLAGRRLSVGRSAFRQMMKCAEIVSSGVTYLIAGFTSRRQALHDIFAGTIVTQGAVRQDETAPRAMAF